MRKESVAVTKRGLILGLENAAKKLFILPKISLTCLLPSQVAKKEAHFEMKLKNGRG